jgi:ADP-ribose pyrophosphatase
MKSQAGGAEMTDERLIEIEKESELIFDGKVLHLYRDVVTLSDGSESIREYCAHNGGVCVLPVTDDGDVLCVRQYRYAHRQITLEIPAGKLEEKDVDNREAALRELKEETGADCKELIYLGKMFPSPALLGEVIHMFFARGLILGKANPDEDEFIECERIPLDKLVDMVCNNEVMDAKTQIAALRVWKMLNE